MLQARGIGDYLARAAAEYPDRVALRCRGATLSYRELSERAARVARGLRSHGMTPGQLLVLVLDQTPEFVEALFGTWMAGGVALPVARMPGGDTDAVRLGAYLQAPLWIVADGMLPALEPCVAEWQVPPRVFVVGESARHHRYETLVVAEPSRRALPGAALVQTSCRGNDQPFGALITDAQLVAFVQATETTFPWVAQPTTVCPHRWGSPVATAALLASVRDAGTYVVPDVADARTVLELVRTGDVTSVCATPHFYRELAELEVREPMSRAVLRYLRSIGPLSVARSQQLERTFHVPVYSSYGPVQAMQHVCVSSPENRRAGTVGKLDPHLSLRVLDEADGIQVTGSWVAKECVGAWHDEYFCEGWLRTPDRGQLDADGFLHVAPRLEPVFDRHDVCVGLWEVEAQLWLAVEVAECCVFTRQVGDEESICAVIAPMSEVALDVARVHAQLRATLAPHKLPEYYAIVEELPRTPSGILLRRKIVAGDYEWMSMRDAATGR